jgi:hypothetical protein
MMRKISTAIIALAVVLVNTATAGVVASYVTSFQVPIESERARTCQGITYDGSYFYLVDVFNWMPEKEYPRILKLTSTGSIVIVEEKEAPAYFLVEGKPLSCNKGLTYDGTYFWMTEVNDKGVYYKFAPGTKSIIASFDTPNRNPREITWDGTYLWEADCVTGIVYKLTTAGSVADSFQARKTVDERFFGVAYDAAGGHIYIGKYGKEDGFECYELDKTYVDFAAMPLAPGLAPFRHPLGMTCFEEDHIWVVDANTDSFVKIKILFQ